VEFFGLAALEAPVTERRIGKRRSYQFGLPILRPVSPLREFRSSDLTEEGL
jgi:hypothetical protein